VHRSLLAGLMLGLGTVAFVDEAVFHQILGWHHFYDRGSSAAGLVSDGLFHALSWFATVGALFLVAEQRGARTFDGRRFAGGWFVGAGAFQLYDGLVQHKLLGLHQVRYGVDLLPYDLVWNLTAAALVVVGLVVLRSARRGAPAPAPPQR
jgi:uncharacterized membrane protein